jgi:hypothetical protein
MGTIDMVGLNKILHLQLSIEQGRTIGQGV